MVRILRGSLEGNGEHPNLGKIRLGDEGVSNSSMLTMEGSARDDANLLSITLTFSNATYGQITNLIFPIFVRRSSVIPHSLMLLMLWSRAT